MLDDVGGGPGGGDSWWQLNDEVVSPVNITLDLAVGGTATSSAKFLVEGLTGETFINANSLTDGFGLSMVSTSNLLSTGGLAQFLWNPSAPTTATGDLFVIDVNGNATITGALFAVRNNGSDIFTVSQTGITSNAPHAFTAAGDVNIAYDLLLSNQTASYIKSNAPLTLQIGESYESNNLSIETYNNGDIIFDNVTNGTIATFKEWVMSASARPIPRVSSMSPEATPIMP
jgi:hypothetical protein